MVPRYGRRISVACDVILVGDHVHGEARVLDLSLPGCLLECQHPVRVGDYIELRIFLPDRAYPIHIPLAAVRWVDGTLVGLEFIRSSEEDQARLNDFVQRHGADREAAAE